MKFIVNLKIKKQAFTMSCKKNELFISIIKNR